jgi:hypothetical protein
LLPLETLIGEFSEGASCGSIADGIQTSTLMFESEVGVSVAAMRQKGGRLVKTAPFGAV